MKGAIGALCFCGLAATAAGAAERLAPPAAPQLRFAPAALPSSSLAPASLSLVELPHRPVTRNAAFLETYLAPQISRRLAPLGEWFATTSLERGGAVDVDGMEVRQNAEQLAWKGTRKAVRSWLGDRFEPEVTFGGSLPSGSASTGGGTVVRFGVTSLRPRVVVERPVGAGSLRFGVNVSGDAHVEWRPSARETRLGATFDASSRRLGLSLAGTF